MRLQRWLLSKWMSVAVVVVVLAIGGVFVQQTTALRRDAFERQVQQQAHFRAVRLQEQLEVRLTMVEGLVRELEQGGLNRGDPFLRRATSMHQNIGGLLALNLVGDDGVIEQVVPEAPNKAALGMNVFAHPVAAAFLREALRTRRPQLSDGLKLFQGGQGFTAYFPVERDDIGAVNAVFRIADVEATVTDVELLRRHRVALALNGSPVITHAPPSRLSALSVSSTFQVRNQSWTLTLTPTLDEVEKDTSSSLAWPVVLLVALLLGSLSAVFAEGVRRQRNMEAHLDGMRRMEALGTLAGGMAHDFNNILTALRGILELNLAEPPSDEAWRQDVRDMLDACTQGATLTEQMLALSRTKTARKEPFLVDEVVNGALRLVRKSLPTSIQVSSVLQAQGVWVEGESSALSQALMNLVINSKDAMPQGGQLTVRTYVDDGDVCIAVEDSGEGIAAEHLDRIFEPFFTTKGVGRGTGLGMAMVYSTVKTFDGHVEVASTPGKGTTVRLRLPSTTAPASPSADQEVSLAVLDGKRIVLVDDESTIRSALRRHLEKLGAHVDSAGSGSAAKRLLDGCDVLITDMRMQPMGGDVLAREAWRRRADLPVVFVSGFSEAEVPRGKHTRFVPKPFALDDVARATAQVLLEAATEEAA